MSALVARAMREPIRFDRDIPGKDRKALEVLVSAGVLKKERQGGVTVFAPVVSLSEFRKPRPPQKPKETVAEWLRKDLAKRAFIPVSEGWKETAWAKSHFRILRDGEPLYFAAYVADWAPWMKRALCRGALNRKDEAEAQHQMDLLFPVQSATRNFGLMLDRIQHAFWEFKQIFTACKGVFP